MTLYKLCDWEENRYHDSYGYLAFYNSETGELGQVMHWATAFAGNLDTSAYLEPCGVALEQARRVLEANIFKRLVESDRQQCREPEEDQIQVGTVVRTRKAVRNKGRALGPCPKCEGSGHWVNPNNPEDKRTCFKCHGQGQVQGAATGESVKIVKGTVGTIVDTYKYGARFKINYTIKAGDGSLFRCGAKSLRLDMQTKSEQHWRERAYALSFHFDFKSAVTKWGGWLSTNWAGRAAQGTYTAFCPHCGGDGRIDQETYQGQGVAALKCCGHRVDMAEWYAYCVEEGQCEAAHWDREHYFTPKDQARDVAIALEDYREEAHA